MQSALSNRTLLVVDDEELILDVLKRQLQPHGYNVLTAESGEVGLQLIKKNQVGVVISDQTMPGMDGIAFLSEVRDIDDEAVLILLTGNSTLDNAIKAINQLQIFSYVTKPWSTTIMLSTIANAFRHHETCSAYKKIVKRWMLQNEDLKRKNEFLTARVVELEKEINGLRRIG